MMVLCLLWIIALPKILIAYLKICPVFSSTHHEAVKVQAYVMAAFAVICKALSVNDR